MVDEKELQFNRLWNEENASKRIQFRNRLKARLDILHAEFTEENARAYYMGRLKPKEIETFYVPEGPPATGFRRSRPPRRGGRR